jgi:3-dehydroquinate synthase
MAEAIKYGAAVDAELLEALAHEHDQLAGGAMGAFERLIAQCVRAKATIVGEDPLERSGRRAVLNFGHTVGHAIEAAMEYRGVLHGEAVMIGMMAEAEVGRRAGLTAPDVGEAISTHAARWSLPTKLPDKGLVERVMQSMSNDKKNVGGTLSMALPERLGVCRLVPGISVELTREVLSE